MAETEFLAVGDQHFKKLTSLFPDGDDLKPQFKAYNHVCSYARSEGIEHIVHLGDVFETPHPDQRTVAKVLEELNNNSDRKQYWIRGNHDWDSEDGNSMEIMDAFARLGASDNNRVYLSPNNSDLDGVPVRFLSYPYTEVPDDGKERIVFAHLEFKGASRDNGTKITGGLALPKKNRWVVGHLHRHQRIGDRVIYPGTLLQLNFGEPLPKGFLRCRAKYRKGVLSLFADFIPYEPPFRLVNLTISSVSDLKQVKSKESIKYKLFVKQGVDIPPSWLVDHPNVVKHEGYRSKQELEEAKIGKFTVEDESSKLDVLTHLPEYLKGKDLTKKQVRFGVRLVKEFIYGT